MAEKKALNIYQKMATISNEMNTVAKNLNVVTNAKTNTGYRAVGEVDIINAVKPLEYKYGIYSYPVEREIIEKEIIETQTQYGVKKTFYLRLKVVYRFVNVDNPSEYIDITSYGDGMDSGDKGTGKAMTYADKYALMKAYKISTGDDPDQEASKEIVGKLKKQEANIDLTVEYNAKRMDLETAGVDTRDPKFMNYVCEHAKVNSLNVADLIGDDEGMKRVMEVYDGVLKNKQNKKKEIIEGEIVNEQ